MKTQSRFALNRLIAATVTFFLYAGAVHGSWDARQYGTGSDSDLSLTKRAHHGAPGRYRSPYRTTVHGSWDARRYGTESGSDLSLTERAHHAAPGRYRSLYRTNAGQSAPEQLEPGKPIEKELSGGGSHSYQITLAEEQFLHVIVEQRGIDVVAQLLGPDGKLIAEFDSEIRKQGQETVSQVAEMAGNYRLVVQAKQKEAPTGRYEIRVAELRAATEKDRALQEARKLSTESVRLRRAGKDEEARPLAERALELREKALGPEHPDVAHSLNNLAILYHLKGDYAKAEPLYQRSLAIMEKALGPEHLDVKYPLGGLADIYWEKGDYAKAEPLFQRELAIAEKALGPEHPDVAYSLNGLASLYRDKGDYAKAEPLHQRALAIREKALGPEHPDVAFHLNNLALLYNVKGDYAQAEPLHQRALAIYEKARGPEHPFVARSLNNLAALYRDKGDYAKAEPLFQRSLAIREKALGPEHPFVARTLNNLAILYCAKGDYAKAEPLHQRALAIKEKAPGPEHYEFAYPLNSLANLYRDKGDYAKAEPLYQRALAVFEKAVGPEHPYVANSLNNIALLYSAKGDYAKAEPLAQRALVISEKALGPEHTDVATSLNSLARFCEAKGETAQAIRLRTRASAISERNLALNLATGSERQKLAYLATLTAESYSAVSLHGNYAPKDAGARNLALTLILQRKGRALDAMSDSISVLRQRINPEGQALLDQLKDTNAQLARLVLGGPQGISPAEHQKQIKILEEEKEKLEAGIGRISAEFAVLSRPITVEAVRLAIPANAALIEFFAYRPANAKAAKEDERFGPPRYVAYVLRREGEVQWTELGEAKAIDEAIGNLRQALRDPKRADVKRLARAVDRKVMQPVRALLGQTRRVFISPDGALNLAPFAALVDEKGKYLIENYKLSYLTSGRDLLRLQAPRENRNAPLIVANPDFDRAPGEALALRSIAQPAGQTRQAEDDQKEFKKISFRALPWTFQEGSDLKKYLPQATLLTGAQATETALKQAAAPRILHIATHGFFLQDAENPLVNARGIDFTSFSDLRSASWAAKIENPLLRSGLALAGVNEHRSGDDDGVLTAMEAANLDLWGTKLVVLSACDTGVGEVKNGEGVYGLRRALVLAGAETQVMSLWPVSDKETRSLMAGYYKRLLNGEGRAEALRQAQLEMLKNPRQRHPFYWASFIQAGEWANLDGKR